ncbi:MAG: helix-hairpin-helix domain-containing protein [Chloroflexota bacterium]|nr:helix-hairpin-helix domain-containing protein [Chloroflexota bacterium]
MRQKRASTPEQDLLRALQTIPSVGPAMAGDLVRLGISDVRQVGEREPAEMFETLCDLDGMRHDPCVLDVFSAAVAYARGEPARPWWEFSRERKTCRP